MTGKERILATMRGEPADRVPVSLFVQEEYLGWYYPGRTPDRVRDAASCARELGFDVMTRSNVFNMPYFLKKDLPGWKVSRSETVENGVFYRRFTVETPARVLRQTEAGPDAGRLTGGLHLSTTEYLLKDEDDVAAFCEHVPAPDDQARRFARDYCSESRSLIGDLGVAAPWGIGGVFNLASTYMDVQKLLMDAYCEEESYRAYMEKICEICCAFDAILAEENREIVGIQGNIANGGMVGRDFFDEFILPYEKRHADVIRQKGALTVYHNCGRAANLLESYANMSIDAWETVAEPPQGDNMLADAKKRVGDRLTLIGNIDQVNFLKTATPGEVAAKTRETVLTGKPGGRYIFAASDYLEAGTPIENVRAMIAEAKSAGVY